MSEIQPYVFPDTGHEVRTLIRDGEPWFVTADVTEFLGFSRSRDAARMVDDEDKGAHFVRTPGGLQQVGIVNESGLYTLILRSNRTEAKRFKRWVTSEVLPAIRRSGRYEVVPQHQIPQSFAEALELAASQAREIEQQRARLDWAEPRAAYVDRHVDGGHDATTVGTFAKQIGVQEKRLREWLIERDLIYRDRYGQYQPRAQLGPRRHWFALKDQPEAPRLHNGQLRTTLYITPAGKTGVEDLIEKYPLTGQGVLAV